jgi:hypothetical protein
VTVSQRERDYMRRVGAFKALSGAEARDAHAARSLDERLQESWALYLRYRDTVTGREADDPTPFYERARALGLYRP